MNPRLAPWATFCRRYAAWPCHGYRLRQDACCAQSERSARSPRFDESGQTMVFVVRALGLFLLGAVGFAVDLTPHSPAQYLLILFMQNFVFLAFTNLRNWFFFNKGSNGCIRACTTVGAVQMAQPSPPSGS